MLGAPAAAVFAVLHGVGNGILSIVKGTLPLVFFGDRGDGLRQGLLTFPARISEALATWLFGLMLARRSVGALGVSAALGMTAFAAPLALRRPGPSGEAARSPAH